MKDVNSYIETAKKAQENIGVPFSSTEFRAMAKQNEKAVPQLINLFSSKAGRIIMISTAAMIIAVISILNFRGDSNFQKSD